MALRIHLQGSPNKPMRFAFVHSIIMSNTFAISSSTIEWAVRTIIGEEGITSNPLDSPNIVASRFSTNIMDLSQSWELTKLVMGAFAHSFAYTWDELNVQLDKYDIFSGDIWWGGFLNRDFFCLIPCSGQCSSPSFMV